MMAWNILCLVFAGVGFAWLAGCGQSEPNLSEEENPNYQRGRDLLRQGREEDAMEQFLQALDESTEAPQTHLELGRLFMQVEGRKDPVQAIFHFRSFLRFLPDAREADNVAQLIATAEKQFLAGLPGKPFGDQLEALQLRERNQALEREVTNLKTRLALHEPEILQPSIDEGRGEQTTTPNRDSESTIVTPRQETYVVKAGDSLYGISLRMYGSPRYIDAIYEANRAAMPNKNSLRLGQRLIIPKVPRP